jgi:hypothetical protein
MGVTSCRCRHTGATQAAHDTIAQWHAAGMGFDGLRAALDDYHQVQDELVEARNWLADHTDRLQPCLRRL